MTDLRSILNAIDDGDQEASKALLPLVYAELRRLAARLMAKEAVGHTLQATALVHEAWLRLVGSSDQELARWDSRGHFFAAAAESMRRILIDRARAKGTQKRTGDPRRLRLDQDPLADGDLSAELIDLDEALTRFAAEDPTKAELVKLRYFAGLTLEQAAGVLNLSPATADRHWSYARAWLYTAMSRE